MFLKDKGKDNYNYDQIISNNETKRMGAPKQTQWTSKFLRRPWAFQHMWHKTCDWEIFMFLGDGVFPWICESVNIDSLACRYMQKPESLFLNHYLLYPLRQALTNWSRRASHWAPGISTLSLLPQPWGYRNIPSCQLLCGF